MSDLTLKWRVSRLTQTCVAESDTRIMEGRSVITHLELSVDVFALIAVADIGAL